MVSPAASEEWTFDLCAGHLALDFANTVSARHTSRPIDRLATFERLVAFGVQTGLCNAGAGKRLRELARRRPGQARAALADAVVLREAIYGIASRRAVGLPVRAADVAVLSERLRRFAIGTDLQWVWESGHDGLDVMLGPVVRAAAELLLSPQRERVQICQADDCAWVFFDTSKNHSRRWCDMKQCGNRAKARRFMQRRAAGARA